MTKFLACLWLAVLPLGWRAAAESTTVIDGQTFTLPDGFEIQQIAGPPLADRPIVADFDDQGRLYVADSAGVNDKVQVQVQTRPHRIVRLEDTDGDGAFDKSIVFADKMMFPEGMLWHEGAVYCAAPPIIWKLEDTDDDGVADERTKWFDVGTLTGCANDLHGPYIGPAGWIYWTKGAFAKLDLTLGDGSKLTDSAAHIFRARPDGSGLESFAAGGMDNPVEIAFGESGDLFFTSTFIVNPGGGKRDGIVHGIYGAVYPKRHGVIEGLSKTGELLEAMTHLGAAAPSGLARYRSEVFGQGFHGNLFSTLFNMRKVMRHVLEPQGATFKTIDTDFVVSDNVDFHPTDVLEDADGSLIILDTGGWYKICCPTSVIAKSDVLGAIYRVRKTGADRPENPRGRGESFTAEHLNAPLPAVRDQAVRALASAGDAAISELRPLLLNDSPTDRAAIHAIWALARMRTPGSRAVIRSALENTSPRVQAAAAYVCGLEKDVEARASLIPLLQSESFAVRREAATALGRIGKSTEALLGSTATRENWGHDSTLAHSIFYAILEQNEEPALLTRLEHAGRNEHKSDWLQQLWALKALQRLNPSALKLEHTIHQSWGGVDSEIAKQHPEWANELAEYYQFIPKIDAWAVGKHSEDKDRLSQFLHWPEVGEVAHAALSNPKTHPAAIHRVIEAIGAASEPVSAPVVEGISSLLTRDEKVALPAILSLNADQLTAPMREALLRWIKDEAARPHDPKVYRDPATILRAADLLISSKPKGPIDRIAFKALIDLLNRPQVGDSGRAAQILAKGTHSPKELILICEQLPGANAFTLPLLLKPFERGGNVALGQTLAKALKNSAASVNLRPDQLEKISAAFPESVRADLQASLRTPAGETDRAAKLAQTAASLPTGDVRNGHQVFKSNKAACAACHRIAYAGGEVGPPLDGIGKIRTRLDLLEAILFPNASFARGYEPMLVTFIDNNTVQTAFGIVSHPNAERIDVINPDGTRHNLHMTQVHEIAMAPTSLMPPGLDIILTKQELADLVAFLQSL